MTDDPHKEEEARGLEQELDSPATVELDAGTIEALKKSQFTDFGEGRFGARIGRKAYLLEKDGSGQIEWGGYNYRCIETQKLKKRRRGYDPSRRDFALWGARVVGGACAVVAIRSLWSLGVYVKKVARPALELFDKLGIIGEEHTKISLVIDKLYASGQISRNVLDEFVAKYAQEDSYWSHIKNAWHINGVDAVSTLTEIANKTPIRKLADSKIGDTHTGIYEWAQRNIMGRDNFGTQGYDRGFEADIEVLSSHIRGAKGAAMGIVGDYEKGDLDGVQEKMLDYITLVDGHKEWLKMRKEKGITQELAEASEDFNRTTEQALYNKIGDYVNRYEKKLRWLHWGVFGTGEALAYIVPSSIVYRFLRPGQRWINGVRKVMGFGRESEDDETMSRRYFLTLGRKS